MRSQPLLAHVATVLLLFIPSAMLCGQTCVTPDPPAIVFTPPGAVSVGQTYAVVWSAAGKLDSDGTYIIERSTDRAFGSLVDSQQTSSTSASFFASAEGIYYHRVRAIAGCNPANSSVSATSTVTVVAAAPNVIFTVQPAATVLAIGDRPSSRTASFVLENITKATVTVAISGTPIGSPPFFTIFDPQGELQQTEVITLSPRQPRHLEIQFNDAVATDKPATYQGVIFLAGQPQSLVVTPYAFVNLKVGANESVAPVFYFQGEPSEYAFFPGHPALQPNPDKITVQIENPGTQPMDLGAEIAPDVWLVPAAGWNANPIAAKQKIDVTLSVARERAIPGSALPRYTYFTVRTKSGQSARLLVQDNDLPAQSAGRPPLDPTIRSYVVPQVVNITTASGRRISRVRISNSGGAAVAADLFFTPAGADGGDPTQVRHAAIAVPANDVVTLTDPLGEVFGAPPPSVGQIEVRAAADAIQFLTVTSDTFVPLQTGGSFSYVLPVAQRGEGARLNGGHTIAGVTATPAVRPSLILSETSGVDLAAGHVTVYDQTGNRIGAAPFSLLRNGELQIDDIVNAAGGTTLAGGRLDIVVESGNGTAMADLVLIDAQRQNAAVIPSQPIAATATTSLRSALWKQGSQATIPPPSYVIPGVVNGNPSGTPNVSFATAVSISAPSGSTATTFTFTYLDALGFLPSVRPVVRVDPGQTFDMANILEKLFGLPPGTNAQGTLLVDVSTAAPISARLTSPDASAVPRIFGALPVVGNSSEALTAAMSGLRRPVYIDGLEQSVDPSRGRTWNLLLSEVAGRPAVVTVRLFEAANRTSAIAEKTIPLGAHQQMRLAPLFAGMGLDSDDRRKDRTNVEAMVLPDSGDGVVVALATSTDNRTSDTTAFLLTPSGGVPPSGVSKVAPVLPPAAPPRRRVARH